MNNNVILTLRIPLSLAQRLEEHKRTTLVPTSAFVRFAVESALGHPVIEAASEPVVQKTYKPTALLVPETKVEV